MTTWGGSRKGVRCAAVVRIYLVYDEVGSQGIPGAFKSALRSAGDGFGIQSFDLGRCTCKFPCLL